MKTKFLALIFVLALVVCAMAACGGGEHTHSYDTVVTAPDCSTETDGFTTYTCECGDTYTGDVVEFEHTWVPNVVEATCQAGGYTLNTCADCGATERTNETAKDPDKHSYETEWSSDKDNHWYAASCGCEDAPEKDLAAHTPDEETGVCTVCGYEVCLHPNKQVSWTQPPTCVTDGVEIFSCADCGLTGHQKILPKTGHEYDEGVVIDPTCTDMGYTLKTCTNEGCLDDHEGHTIQSDWVMPSGHEFDGEGKCEVCELVATVRITFVYIDAEGVTVTNHNEQFLVADNENPNYYLVTASRPNTQDFRYTFAGWYLDEACTEAITIIDTRIPQELTIYGKWNAESTSDHVHTFESEWDFDEYEHWRNSTCEHRDETIDVGAHSYDADSYCTVCGRRDPNWEKTYDVTWSETQIIIQLNEDSNNTELPASSKRYLAGETGDNATVDTMIRNRNAAATTATKVKAKYAYIEDGTGYGWGKNIDQIFSSVGSTASDKPDVFVNFVYDMLAASLKGCFANLITGNEEKMGVNHFQFKDAAFKDTGTGYMVEYMRSMTLSMKQMYLLSSDYFIDMVRAFLIVPVNLKMLGSIGVDEGSLEEGYVPSMADEFNSDRDGDGDFDVEDFYKLVWQNEWNYETLADFADAIFTNGQAVSGGGATGTLNDELGFAISTGSGLSASGMLYTTTIEIIARDWSDETNNYTFSYPTTNQDLLTFCNNISNLFSVQGVIAIGDTETLSYGTDALRAIRNRFAEGHILFGGVICLGSLEYDEYTQMDGGFGVVPVPLYRVGDENGRADEYQTQIHNLGRVGAISRSTSKFSQCSAYLDYQSTHSTDILNDYYENELSYAIAGGSDSNVQMLQYIRRNVRSSFDKAFEDAIGIHFSNDGDASVGGTDMNSMDQKWHTLIKDNGYRLGADEMKVYYDALIGVKKKHLETLKNSYNNLPL